MSKANYQDLSPDSLLPNAVFGSQYADSYDLFYREKDYAAECDLIEEAFRRYGGIDEVKCILDLGCGTGNHALPLAQRGYHVTGVDRSAEMLSHARQKISVLIKQGSAAGSGEIQTPPVFLEGDVRTLDISPEQFDAVLMMFAVLGYQLTNDDVLAALFTVHRHLKPGGLFICDVWYGPAVLAIRPGDRFKVIPITDGPPGRDNEYGDNTADGKILRAASGRLDVPNHLAIVDYRIWRLHAAQVVSETTETHRMRYFFPQELELFMRQAGLRLLAIKTFADLDRAPSEMDWNIIAIAKG